MSEPARTLFVVGHKNPDTDSVCSAVAYARLKSEHLGEPAVPCRAGNLNRQTAFVLSHFDVESPRLLTDVYPKVSDIMVKGAELIVLRDSDPLSTAYRIMTERSFSFIPVADDAGRCVGRVTALRLAELLGDLTRLDELPPVTVRVKALGESLGAELLLAPDSGDTVRGALVAGTSRQAARARASGGKLIHVVSGESGAAERALADRPALLVLCGGAPEPSFLETARGAGVGVVSTPLDAVHVVVRILLQQPVGGLLDRQSKLLGEHDLVKRAQAEMSKSNEGGFIVTDDEKRVSGVITRLNLLERSRFRLVLVDHNELAQAVDGAEEAEIVEIIDHHRLGTRSTDAPITFINRVVGSTSTIVADLYRSQSLRPDRKTAGIMLAALLSDTLILRSPTTTPIDQVAARWLSELAGVEVDAFGEHMFHAGSALEDMDGAAILAQDRKVYEESRMRFAVSQVEVVGFSRFETVRGEVAKALGDYLESTGFDFGCLMVTDLTRGSSELLCAGDARIIDAISYPRVGEGLFEMKGVLSRKKQVLPYLLDVIRSAR